MKFKLKILEIKSIRKIEGSWSKEDYIHLLELFDYSDAESVPEAELFDMLSMAMSDFEPAEAAEIVLTYKLSEKLGKGQIKNLSHEMLEDNLSEEYPDLSLHYPLFTITQLLYDAYNGKFPRVKASVIDFELQFDRPLTITKEVVLRTMSDLLTEKSLLKRLFNEQLDADDELHDAKSIIWELMPIGENSYRLITSDYWLNEEDFETTELSGNLREDEINRSRAE